MEIRPEHYRKVPQSGIGYGIGYHQKSGLPYEDFFYLNSFSKRSYIPSDPEIREQVAREKLSVIKSGTKSKRIVICEDSIVSGNQLLRLRNTLKEKGEAKEVHARVGCPPLRSPCPYTQTTKEYSDLIYNRWGGDIGSISDRLNLDSLKYNSVEDLVNAIGLLEEKLCLARSSLESETRDSVSSRLSRALFPEGSVNKLISLTELA